MRKPLSRRHHPPCVPRHLKTWGYTPCEDALLRKLGLMAGNSLMVAPCPLILNPFSFLNEDLLTPLSGRGRKDGGREESGDAQGSPSGNPQVSPTKPSSVIGSTLARIVRGPGSVPGWGLGNVVTALGFSNPLLQEESSIPFSFTVNSP